ncbi:ribosomal protein L9 [Candidatus Regiella insecticola 5.15]|uniref:Large ribosomal subunit protein bL9 n=1 Tax=Candidatus Regiella insecticola 5.15 TaxID=1005043 RepID=G2H066_9ENTR|nr:50S ribosomal protein L9 [Candidatus Regiella insecticola]EGY28593.1 ribosomal protein L9 [Candidatus Regiella insecticola 5.15]
MRVILLEKVEKLGELGDIVNVAAGYARNFLFPQSKAEPANKKNIELLKENLSARQKQADEILKASEVRAIKINELQAVTLFAKAGNEGKLFGSISSSDIVAAVKEAGIDLDKKEINLPKGGLRTLGEHEIHCNIHREVTAKLNVIVAQEA